MVCLASVDVEHPRLLLAPTICRLADVELRMEHHAPNLETADCTVFFAAHGEAFERLDAVLQRDQTIREARVVLEESGHRVYRAGTAQAAKVVRPRLASLDVHLVESRSRDRGWRLRLQMAERDQLTRFGTHCEQEGVDLELNTVAEVEQPIRSSTTAFSAFGLTGRQREVVTTAVERGYFDDETPNEVVAEALDITPSTLSEHMKTVQSKVFTELFDDGDDGDGVSSLERP